MAKTRKILENQFDTDHSWHGITHKNHLSTIGMDDQFVVLDKITNLYDVNLPMDMVSFVEKFGTYTVKKREFHWHLQGNAPKNYPIKAAWEDRAGSIAIGTNNIAPGSGQSTFYIDFEEKYFSVTEVIVGHKVHESKLLVNAEPFYTGNVWRFSVELVTGSSDDSIALSELTPGKRFSSEYGLVPTTMSYRGADVGFQSPAMLKAETSMFRLQHTVPGDMVRAGKVVPFKFYFRDETGKTHMSWISNVEWEILKKIKLVRSHLIKYGKSNRMADGGYGNKDANGFNIEAGAGWHEQIVPSNLHTWGTAPNIDELIEIALDATVGKTKNRIFTITAGEYGLVELSRAIERKLGSVDYKNAAWLQDHMGRAYSWSGNNIAVNLGEFNKVVTVRGITFIMMLDPFKDDTTRNKDYHPKGGLVSSYEYDIMGFGMLDETANMQTVRVEGEDPVWGVVGGMRSPWADKASTSMNDPKALATPIDGATIHYMETVGGIVWDPTKVVRYYPELSYS